MKRLLPLMLALVLVISVIVPAYATGDGNFDGGGGGMGNGSKTNYWNPGMDGVRVSIVGVHGSNNFYLALHEGRKRFCSAGQSHPLLRHP